MTPKIIRISPKGQITIPIEFRYKMPTDQCSFEFEEGKFILRPIEIKVLKIEDEFENFAHLSQKSFEFWDNPDDDVYDKFYQ